MDPFEAVTIAAVGLGAGIINAVVGSGTLITFPTLVALGYPPVSANISNNIGLLGGGVAGAWGYREELRREPALIRQLAPASALGALAGGAALLTAPARAFETVVPVLITLALLLVLAQPALARRIRTRPAARPITGGVLQKLLPVGVALAGIYGGYFGAAQGVLLIGIIGLALPGEPQRVNGLKNVLTLVVNLVAAVLFLTVRPAAVQWPVVALIAIGSWAGGYLGARWGRRLPPALLRSVVVAVGCTALARFMGYL